MNEKGTRWLGVILGLAVAMQTVFAPITVQAVEMDTILVQELEENYNGYSELDVTIVDSIDASEIYQEGRYRAGADNSWSDFGSDYFYKQLTGDKKTLYESLWTMSMEYLTTNRDMDGLNTDFVDAGSLSYREAMGVAQMFFLQNPQFYFYNSSTMVSYNNLGTYLALGVYSDYANGGTRMTATNQMRGVINNWLTQIDSQSSLIDKEAMAFTLVMDNTDYVQNVYDQSCVSVFLYGQSVCAGYSQAFALLCNAIGIDTIAVTSTDHEWNMVQINNQWYNVDVTWGDGAGGSAMDYYFNVSDSSIKSGNSSHVKSGNWMNGLTIPTAPSDFAVENYVSITGVYIPNDNSKVIQAGAIIDGGESGTTYECTVIDYDAAAYGLPMFPEKKTTTDKNDNWMTYTPSHPGMYGFCWRGYQNGSIVTEFGATHYFAGNTVSNVGIWVPDRNVDTLNFGMVFNSPDRDNVRITWFLYRPDDNVYEAILSDGLVSGKGVWQQWTKKAGRYWIMCRVTAANNAASSLCWGVEVRNGVVIDPQ